MSEARVSVCSDGSFRPMTWTDAPFSGLRLRSSCVSDDGSADVRLYNMENEPVPTNRTCCGLPPVQ